MVSLVRVAGETYVGGLYVNADLKDVFVAGGVIRFDWDRLDKSDFTRLLSTVKQGFNTSSEGVVGSLLHIFESLDGVPPYPKIGYFGKKNMNVLVLADKAELYKTDLIAAGQMLDVDLSDAATVGRYDDPRWNWVNVSGYNVRQMGPKNNTPRWTRRQDGSHLKPATSKMMDMVRVWTAELYPDRVPFINWIKSRHNLTFTFKS